MGVLIYFIRTAFIHPMPGLVQCLWHCVLMEIRIFIPGHSSEGLLLPWVCLPVCFSYLFTSMWERLVLLVFPQQEFG